MIDVVLEASVDTTDTPAREPGEFVMLIVRKMVDKDGNPLPGPPSVLTATMYNPEIFRGAKKAKVTIELS